MVHWKGMLGLVRLRMLRAPISKYSTGAAAGPLAARRLLWAAILAMPISSGISLFSLFLRQRAIALGWDLGVVSPAFRAWTDNANPLMGFVGRPIFGRRPPFRRPEPAKSRL